MLFHCTPKRPNYYNIMHATPEPKLGLIYALPPPSPETNSTMMSSASISKIHQWPYFPKSTSARKAFIICLLIEGKERGKEEEGSERGTKGWGENEGLYGLNCRSAWLASHEQRSTEDLEDCAVTTFGLAQASDPWGLWSCCQRPPICFSKQLAVMDKYSRTAWHHVFYEFLSIQLRGQAYEAFQISVPRMPEELEYTLFSKFWHMSEKACFKLVSSVSSS